MKHHPSAGHRLQALASRGLPSIPRRVLLARTSLMARHCVFSIAGFWCAGPELRLTSFEAFVTYLIDAIAGYLSAPVSELNRAHPEPGTAASQKPPQSND